MEIEDARHLAALLRWFVEAEKEEFPWLMDERWANAPLAVKVKEAEALLQRLKL